MTVCKPFNSLCKALLNQISFSKCQLKSAKYLNIGSTVNMQLIPSSFENIVHKINPESRPNNVSSVLVV